MIVPGEDRTACAIWSHALDSLPSAEAADSHSIWRPLRRSLRIDALCVHVAVRVPIVTATRIGPGHDGTALSVRNEVGVPLIARGGTYGDAVEAPQELSARIHPLGDDIRRV